MIPQTPEWERFRSLRAGSDIQSESVVESSSILPVPLQSPHFPDPSQATHLTCRVWNHRARQVREPSPSHLPQVPEPSQNAQRRDGLGVVHHPLFPW